MSGVYLSGILQRIKTANSPPVGGREGGKRLSWSSCPEIRPSSNPTLHTKQCSQSTPGAASSGLHDAGHVLRAHLEQPHLSSMTLVTFPDG